LHHALRPADSEVDIVCCSGRGDKDLAEVLSQPPSAAQEGAR
jgi:tryptophan synthase beta subunit